MEAEEIALEMAVCEPPAPQGSGSLFPGRLAAMPDRVAIVEDDPDQRSLLDRGLRHRGFQVLSYSDRTAARKAFRSDQVPDLAILDVNLNGEDPADRDGFALCRELLTIPGAEQVPVIFLTRLEDHQDQLEGSTLAVAYVQKPPALDLLAAQIRALLAWSRRLYGGEPSDTQVLCCGDLRVDLGANQASWKGRVMRLTYSEFEVQRVLAANSGKVVSYEDLCEAIGSNVADNTIATHIQNLRRKFADVDPDFPRTTAIRSIPKRGYVWEIPRRDA